MSWNITCHKMLKVMKCHGMSNVIKCQMSWKCRCWCWIYDPKQKQPELHTSEHTIVPRTVISDLVLLILFVIVVTVVLLLLLVLLLLVVVVLLILLLVVLVLLLVFLFFLLLVVLLLLLGDGVDLLCYGVDLLGDEKQQEELGILGVGYTVLIGSLAIYHLLFVLHICYSSYI